MKQEHILEIFKILSKKYPDAKTELHYTNPYTLLVAVALSAQSTDKGVNKATALLFSVVKTPQDMVNLGEEGLKQYIRTIGLYNNKAKNVIKLSQILVDLYGGEVPASREALESLPGVGRKTANVVLNVAFGQPAIAVDTHIFRVSNRLELSVGKTPLAVERGLEAALPEHLKLGAHYLLILHGRYTCKALRPLCEICPLSHLCPFFKRKKETL